METQLYPKPEGESFKPQNPGAKIVIDQNDGHEKFLICSGHSAGWTQDTNSDPGKPCIPAKALQANNPGPASKQLTGCSIWTFNSVIVLRRQS